MIINTLDSLHLVWVCCAKENNAEVAFKSERMKRDIDIIIILHFLQTRNRQGAQ
jgi:hypothetical protein